MSTKTTDIAWLDEPEPHDYDAATDYLGLLTPMAHEIVELLHYHELYRYGTGKQKFVIPVKQARKAKDLLRATGDDGNPLSALLPAHNTHVAKDLAKIRHSEPLSPVLLVVDTQRARLVIADGHHRVCACYHHDENSVVHARIAYW